MLESKIGIYFSSVNKNTMDAEKIGLHTKSLIVYCVTYHNKKHLSN